MLERIPFLALTGAYVLLVGGLMAIWPRTVTSMSQDGDGKPIPVTPANVRWVWILGVALVLLGIILIVSGFLGVKGDPDPVLI
jgi:hypothetical protein